MKYNILFIILIIFLAWCNTNNNNIKKIDTKTNTEIKNNIETKTENFKDITSLLELAKIDNNKKENIKKEITKINNDIKNNIWTKVIWFNWLLVYSDLFKTELVELKELNENYEKIKNLNNNNVNIRLKKNINQNKIKIYNLFKNNWLSNDEIKDLEKLISSTKSKEIFKEINDISKNIILENWEIVSNEFKEEYEIAKQKLIWKIWIDSENTNWMIPYQVVIEQMLNEKYIKAWECNKINNEMEKIYCESNK